MDPVGDPFLIDPEPNRMKQCVVIMPRLPAPGKCDPTCGGQLFHDCIEAFLFSGVQNCAQDDTPEMFCRVGPLDLAFHLYFETAVNSGEDLACAVGQDHACAVGQDEWNIAEPVSGKMVPELLRIHGER